MARTGNRRRGRGPPDHSGVDSAIHEAGDRNFKCRLWPDVRVRSALRAFDCHGQRGSEPAGLHDGKCIVLPPGTLPICLLNPRSKSRWQIEAVRALTAIFNLWLESER